MEEICGSYANLHKRLNLSGLIPDLLGWNNCTSLATAGLNGSGIRGVEYPSCK